MTNQCHLFFKKLSGQAALEKYEALEYVQCLNNPDYFIETYVKVPHPTKGKIHPDLFPYQKYMLDIYQNNRYSIGVVARQMGTTMVTTSYLLWRMIFHPNRSILISSNTKIGSEEILSRMSFSIQHLPSFLKPTVTIHNKSDIAFDNGSKIFARSVHSSSLRGVSLTDVYLDNFSYGDDKKARDFYHSIVPCVASNQDSRIIITSTANLESDLFAKIWIESAQNGIGKVGPNGYRSFKVTWRDNPNNDESFKDRISKMMGERTFRTEFECEFDTAI